MGGEGLGYSSGNSVDPDGGFGSLCALGPTFFFISSDAGLL